MADQNRRTRSNSSYPKAGCPAEGIFAAVMYKNQDGEMRWRARRRSGEVVIVDQNGMIVLN